MSIAIKCTVFISEGRFWVLAKRPQFSDFAVHEQQSSTNFTQKLCSENVNSRILVSDELKRLETLTVAFIMTRLIFECLSFPLVSS